MPRLPLVSLTFLALMGCTATPGPIEIQANALAMDCNRGIMASCQQAVMMTNVAGLERQQRQRDADEAGKAGVGIALLILGAVLGAR